MKMTNHDVTTTCTHLCSIVHETCIDWVVQLAGICMRISIVNHYTTVAIYLRVGESIWVRYQFIAAVIVIRHVLIRVKKNSHQREFRLLA